jgi:hypothetical protein
MTTTTPECGDIDQFKARFSAGVNGISVYSTGFPQPNEDEFFRSLPAWLTIEEEKSHAFET